MARRTQLVRPTLCGYGCVIEQEWDDQDAVAQPRLVRFHARCARHRDLSVATAYAAIEEESDRFNRAMALLDAQGAQFGDIPAWIADDGALEVKLPRGVPVPRLPLVGIRFK